MAESIITWAILCVGAWVGIIKFLLLLIAENERKLAESERSWGELWN